MRPLSFFLFLCVALLLLPVLAAEGKMSLENNMNMFAVDLYKTAGKAEGNVFLSPYSVYTALSMAYDGASDETKTEMQHFLKIKDVDGFHKNLAASVTKSKDTVLTVANAVWLNPAYTFQSAYVDLLKSAYDAHAEATMDAGVINKWAAEKTRGKISPLLDKKQITEDTVLVLTNAVYFLGAWQTPFDIEATEEAYFNGWSGPKDSDFLQNSGYAGYHEDKSAQYLELDYKGGDQSMVVMLPKDPSKEAFTAFEKELSAAKIQESITSLKNQKVHYYVPKFESSLGGSIIAALRDMGLTLATSDEARFCGMTEKCDLKIGDVIHKTYILVNETGTEASAATAVLMREAGSARKEPPKEFQADHPFVYLIRDKKTGVILFMGRYTGPA